MFLYGYTMKNGQVVIVPEEADHVRHLFTRFADGAPLVDSAARIPLDPKTCKKMLQNPRYQGWEGYPAIVSSELFASVQSELKRRAAVRKPKSQPKKIFDVPVQLNFCLSRSPSPTLSRAQLYELIVAAPQSSTISPSSSL